jgi:hypothetical protein
MYFRSSGRYNPATGRHDWYYRLVESYRNALGEVRQRTVLSVGFVDYLKAEQLNDIAAGLNARLGGEIPLFEDPETAEYVNRLYDRLVKEKKVDRHKEKQDKNRDWQNVDLDTLKNKDVSEIGSEWLVSQAIDELGIPYYLRKKEWDEERVALAKTHLMCRAVYPASEYRTVRYMKENSSACEITSYPKEKVNHYKLYDISKALYGEKAGLEEHLSRRTNELFDLQDRIILYDLTNTYFEGEKRASMIARRGRSKEKRNDCPLVVLALVVNVEGFIKYSSIYRGNISEPATLSETIDRLRLATSESEKKAIVVMDAGIATSDNLRMLEEKGYKYVCVKRGKLKDYSIAEDSNPVVVLDNKGREIELRKAETENEREYYLKVTSPGKAMTEASMTGLFFSRFEEGLQSISSSLSRKGGTKKYDKVCERIGRLKEKYPSVNRMFDINIEKDDKDVCTAITWSINRKVSQAKEEATGVYFLQSNIEEAAEKPIWIIYNCIRNIESSFRCLKTDLDLRPVFHKTDEAAEAHLYLGLLAYQVVNTIRHKLKAHGIHSSWKEINRIMKTQKCVTTTIENDKEQIISMRRCSEPNDRVRLIYDSTGYRYAPFIRKKSVVPKTDVEKKPQFGNKEDTG